MSACSKGIVLVTGPSGCGKSTLTQRLADVLSASNVSIVHQDDHFNRGGPKVANLYKDAVDDRVERPDFVNFNAVIRAIEKAESVVETPCPIILVEGHMLLSSDDLVAIADLIIFLEVKSMETALKRRIGRQQRSDEQIFYISRYYRRFVWPAHMTFVVPKLESLVAQRDPRLHVLRAEYSADLLTEKALAVIGELRK